MLTRIIPKKDTFHTVLLYYKCDKIDSPDWIKNKAAINLIIEKECFQYAVTAITARHNKRLPNNNKN